MDDYREPERPQSPGEHEMGGHKDPGERVMRYDRRPHSLMTYFLLVIVGAIIGGMVVTVLAPSLYGGRFLVEQLPSPKIPEPTKAASPSDATPETVVSNAPAVSVNTKLGPAVVGIANRATIGIDFFGRPAQRDVSGSGFIFAENGYIITNNHVVESATELSVSLADGRRFAATVVGADKNFDLAVIKVDAEDLPTAELGDSDQLCVGDIAIAIGNPVGNEFQRSVTQGIISGLDRLLRVGDQTFSLIQTDAVINPGNSGGPLANAEGEVIGINTLKLDIPRVEGMGFAIPINIARPIINELLTKGRVQWPWLGVYLIDQSNAAQFDIALEYGVYVADTVQGGPAAKAGIKQADLITEIDGQAVNSVDELRVVTNRHRAGDEIEIRVERKDEVLQIRVVLGEVPDESANR